METVSYCDRACFNQGTVLHAKILHFIDYSKSIQGKSHYCQMLRFSLLTILILKETIPVMALNSNSENDIT